MSTELKFKTTINCGGCIAKVTPLLNKIEGIKNWSVNTDNPDKILTLKTESTVKDEVIKTIKSAGFKIEPIEEF